MTLLDWVNRVTENGTICAIPNSCITRRVEENYVGDGSGGRSGWQVECFGDEWSGKKKKNKPYLEDITMRVLACKSDNASLFRLYNALMVKAPKDFRNGQYDADSWMQWLLQMTDTITAEIQTGLFRNLYQPSAANTLLKTLTIRSEAWSTKTSAHIDIPENSKPITVNIEF